MLLKQGEKVAFGGVLAALSALLVLGAGLFPTMTYAMPAISGVLLIAAVIELGKRWAFFCYAAVAVLSLLLGTDKESALLFALLLGYYPILKSLLDPMRPRALQWACKLLIFNAAAVASYLLAVFVLGVPLEAFSVGGVSWEWLLLLLGNAVFVVYDRAVSGLAVLYCRRLHPAVLRIFHK